MLKWEDWGPGLRGRVRSFLRSRTLCSRVRHAAPPSLPRATQPCPLSPPFPDSPLPPGTPAPPYDNFTLISTLPLPGTYDWDFLTFDPVAQTLLIGRRDDGVSVIDARDPAALKFVASVSDTFGSNGVTLLPDLRLGVSNNGGLKASTATVFTLPTPENGWATTVLGKTTFRNDLRSCGSSVYLGNQRTLAFTHHHRNEETPAPPTPRKSAFVAYALSPALLTSPPSACGDACLLEPQGKALDTMLAGLHMGKLHGAHLTPDGVSVWLVIEAASEMYRVHALTGEVLQTVNVATAGCAIPTPAGYDDINGLIFVGCRGGSFLEEDGTSDWRGIPLLATFDTKDGALLYSAPIGRHIDGLTYVPARTSSTPGTEGWATGRIFVACGGDASITVFEQVPGAPHRLRPLESITSRIGAKTIAVDAKRRIVYTAVPSANVRLNGVDVGIQEVANTASGGELYYPCLNCWNYGTYQVLAYQAHNSN